MTETEHSITVRQLRHRAEIPMLSLAGLITLVGVAVAIAAGSSAPTWATAAAAGLLVPILAATVLIRFQYWRQISNSVEVTENQLSEIHAIYIELCAAMDMPQRPRLYVANGNGAINAYASKCRIRRSYVVIYSDLIDVAYELGDFNAIRFVLAHELGHIKCGHVNLWRNALLPVATVLGIGPSVSRAQEYTADRCGAFYAPEGAQSLMVLFAGKRIYNRVDIDAYRDSARDHGTGFWLRVANFFSGHAVGFRRMEPLAEIETAGWDVHGKML